MDPEKMTCIETSITRAGLLLHICLIALCTLTPPQASADIYKWVDDEGKINYTQIPPPPGFTSEIIKQASAPAVAPAPPESNLQEHPEEERKDPENEAAKAKLEKENAEIRRLNCDAATRNLVALEQGSQRRYLNADGELLRPTDEERQQLIDKTRQQIKENCTE
jgi:hypothetical protein